MSDGWIEHKGNVAPCGPLELVAVRYQDGSTDQLAACQIVWTDRVVAWKPVKCETKQVLQRLYDQIAERMRQRYRKAERRKQDGFAIAYRGQVLGLLDALNMVKDAMGEQDNGKR